MAEGKRFTRLRATFRNSVVWGTIWGAIGTGVAATMRLIDRIGFMGALAGAVFFAFMILAYRGKRLSEISWMRFGIGGAVVCGLFVPFFLQSMNLLTGGPLVSWNLLSDDFVLAALFGGITAAGTMLIAQRDEAAHPVTVQELLDQMEQESLGTGEAKTYRQSERWRSAERP